MRPAMRPRSLFLAKVLGLVAWTFCARAQESALQPPNPVDAPGPSQAELDRADVEPTQWLPYNKGYLGYRFSKLAQINAQNVSQLKPECSFKLGEQDSFQNGPLVYDGALYTTSPLGTFAVDAATCELLWAYRRPPGRGIRNRRAPGLERHELPRARRAATRESAER